MTTGRSTRREISALGNGVLQGVRVHCAWSVSWSSFSSVFTQLTSLYDVIHFSQLHISFWKGRADFETGSVSFPGGSALSVHLEKLTSVFHLLL